MNIIVIIMIPESRVMLVMMAAAGQWQRLASGPARGGTVLREWQARLLPPGPGRRPAWGVITSGRAAKSESLPGQSVNVRSVALTLAWPCLGGPGLPGHWQPQAASRRLRQRCHGPRAPGRPRAQ